jgi:hypothetical protein
LLLVNKDTVKWSSEDNGCDHALELERSTCGAAGGTKSSATKRTLKTGLAFDAFSPPSVCFFLPLSSTHNTETSCVCLASETTDQHSLSSRSPVPRIRVQTHQTPRHSDHRRQFMYSSRRSQRLAVPDPPKLQPFRILRRPCSNQITND